METEWCLRWFTTDGGSCEEILDVESDADALALLPKWHAMVPEHRGYWMFRLDWFQDTHDTTTLAEG